MLVRLTRIMSADLLVIFEAGFVPQIVLQVECQIYFTL